jgi:hypothetical protein
MAYHRCATCGCKCNEDRYCYGCKHYQCGACEKAFGIHIDTNHPLPRLTRAAKRALVMSRKKAKR